MIGRLRLRVGLACALLAAPWSARASGGVAADLDLPRPDGRYAVGTRTIVLTDSQRQRDLLVTFWYPAGATKASPASYMGATTAAAVAGEWTVVAGFERRVRTNARSEAPVLEGGPFPVVLLEHGSGVVPAAYTVLAEGLASRGLVVAATNHPPDSLIAVYPDGHELRSAPYWPLDADRRAQGVAIGKFAEDVLVRDARFVLDRLAAAARSDPFWKGRLDLSRVGIAGHSMGGTTAAVATRVEPRIVAGANLDGSTFPGMNGDVRPVEVRKPFLFLMTEEHAAGPDHGREYSGKASDSYYVVLPGADHMCFTDVRLVQARLGRNAPADGGAFERALLALESTRTLVGQFFGKYLQGDVAPVLDAPVRVDRK